MLNFFFPLSACVLRVMGRSPPVSGDPPAPAPTAPLEVTDGTPRRAPPRTTAEQVSATTIREIQMNYFDSTQRPLKKLEGVE